ncbi:MAG TPA: hypothetical protein H9700_03995 [Candidatus Eisenbergiella intestinipullorum]|nr:hypothetical protein [Candidatus Eisenbergiella intestinipullorum]
MDRALQRLLCGPDTGKIISAGKWRRRRRGEGGSFQWKYLLCQKTVFRPLADAAGRVKIFLKVPETLSEKTERKSISAYKKSGLRLARKQTVCYDEHNGCRKTDPEPFIFRKESNV